MVKKTGQTMILSLIWINKRDEKMLRNEIKEDFDEI